MKTKLYTKDWNVPLLPARTNSFFSSSSTLKKGLWNDYLNFKGILSILMVAFLVLSSQLTFGQTTIYSSNCSSASTNWTYTNGTTVQPIQQGGYWLIETNDVIISEAFNVSSFNQNITLSFKVGTYGSGNNNPCKVDYSEDNGVTWSTTSYTSATPSSSTLIASGNISLPISNSNQFKIRFRNNGTGKGVRVDDILFTGQGVASTPEINSVLVANANYNTAFNYTITASQNPTSYNATGLPTGLSINTTTGVISGSPTQTGVFNATISAANTAGTGNATLVITVNKGNQTISFVSIPSKTYGDSDFILNATASSSLPITYTSSNPSVATVTGNMVTVVGVGATNIVASQSGDDNYNTATAVTQELVVNKANQTITFGTLIDKLDSDADFQLFATTSSGLPITYTSSNESVVLISGNTASIVGSGTVIITASQGGNENYNAAIAVTQNQVIINTALESQEITFNALPAVTYGDVAFELEATVDSGLSISYTSSDETIASVTGNVVTIHKPGTVTITASQVGGDGYNPAASVQQELIINKKNLTVSNVIVEDKIYNGTTTAGVTSYAINGTVGNDAIALNTSNAVFENANAGTNKLVVPNFILNGLDAANYELVQPSNVMGTILKATQSIIFNTLSSYTTATPSFILNGTASSGLTVTYSSSNTAVATISGNTVTIVGAGTAIITAIQSGNDNYNAASDVTQSLVVTRANEILVAWQFGSPAATGTETTYNATTNDNRLTTAVLSRGSGISTTSLGRAFAATSWLATAGSNTKSDAIASNEYFEFSFAPKAGQAVTLKTLDATLRRSGGTAPNAYIWRYSLNGTTFNDIGSDVNFSSTADGQIQTQIDLASIAELQNVPAGTTVKFRIYAWGGTSSTATFSIGRYASGATTNSLVVSGYVDQLPAPVISSSLNASGTVGQAFNYATTASNVPSSYSAESLPSGLSINTTTGVIAGTPSAAGTFNVSLSATNLSGTDTKVVVISITKADQVITFNELSAKTYGDLSFSLNGTASSGLALNYSSSNTDVATVVGNTVTIVGAGSTTITATQSGNDNYNSAIEIARELIINKADQTITFEPLASRLDTDESFTLTATASSGLPVSFTSEDESIIAISGNVATIVGSGTAVINATQGGNTNYNPATLISREQLIINTQLANQTITFEPLTESTYGDAPFGLNAIASSGLVITYVSSDEAIASINGNIVTLLQPGTVTITALQEGNASYNPAPASIQTLVIGKKQLSVSEVVVAEKTYDGTNNAQINSYQLNGIVSMDEVSLTNSAVFEQVGVGQDIAVTSNFELTGLHADRYTLVQPTGVLGSIVKADQVITFGVLPSKVFGDAVFTISATGGASGQTIVFTSSDESIATVSGNQVTILAGGTVQITASQLGNENYNDAVSVSQDLVIAPRVQYINGFTSLGTKYISTQPFTLNASASSALEIVYTSSNTAVATIEGNVVTIVGLGQTEITATQAGDTNYEPITQVRLLKIIPDPIAAWNLYGLNQTATATATSFANLVTSNNGDLLTRGAGAGASTGANSFRTTGFKNDGISVNNTDYFQFQLQPTEGYQMNLASIDASFIGTASFYANSGVTSQFAYSLNGTTFTLIGNPVTSSVLAMDTVDLTQIAELQNIPNGSTVTFRYYASGQTTTGGWGFSSPALDADALAIGGSLVALPATPRITAVQNCDGTATLTTDATGTILWSTAETSNTIVVTTAGSYSVTQTINNITSNSGLINVTPILITTPIVESQSFCSSVAPKISDIVATGQNIKVYGDSEKTILLNGDSLLESATYYVTQTIETCESQVVAIQITINQAVTYYVDADQDGYGSTTTVSLCVATAPEGYAVNNTDCDDTNSQVWQTGSFYVDADADTYGAGEAVSLCYGATTPSGYAVNNTDCDDTNSQVWQTGSFYVDADADTYGAGQLVSLCYGATTPSGYALNNTDCDDANVLEWQSGSFYVDADADTYGTGELVSICYGTNTPAGYAANNTDCDDANVDIWRSATFYVDADSDGYDNGSATVCYGANTPSGYATTTNGSDCNDNNVNIHTAITYYVDADQDGYGSTTTASLCSLTAPEGYATNNTDCDDTNAQIWRSATFYVDADSDGYDNGSATVCYGANTPAGYATTTNGSDCNDANAQVWRTGSFYVDTDGDTYGAGDAVSLCYGANTPSGYAVRAGDCNNANALVNPGATEICGNSIDDNCNGQTDEGCVVTTQIQTSQCGATLAALNTLIYVDVVEGATAYRYEVSGGGYATPRVYTGGAGLNYFNLTQVSGGATFETTYSIRVAYKLGSIWQVYGTACNVTTPTPTTKVQSSQCGVTLSSVAQTILADAVTGISGYRFEVTNGTTVRTFDTANGATNSFKLTQLTGGATLGMAYSVRVAVKYPSGVWGPFGQVCMVYTQSTQVQASQCGITLDTPSTLIYTDAIATAEAYRFEVTNGATVRTYETASAAINYFSLTQLTGSIPYATAYSIRVASKYAGIWGDYGQSCTVSTGAALTKVQLSQCGITLPTIGTVIYADPIIGATTYRFEVSGGGYATPRVYTGASDITYFNLTQVSGGALYGTTYSVRVAHKSAGIWSAYGTACTITTPTTPESKVQSAQCNTTLATISTNILADAAYGALAYRFEVTNGATVRTFDTANGATNFFKLSQLSGGGMYSTTYAIRVAVKYGSGVWGAYGSSCNVTTPGFTTNVFPSQCGVTLASVSTTINAVAVSDPLVSAYRFEITNGNTVRVYTTANGATNYFKLTQLSGGVLYNTAYSIRAAVKYNGLWQAYGTSCNVTTPAVQTVKVISSQCGITVQPSTVVTSETAPLTVTKYRFELTAGATVLTYENVLNRFRIKDVPGYQMGTTYAVRVAYQYNGVWFDYGQSCNLTLPSLITKVQASRCGTTVSTSTRIYTDALSATPSRYRFELTAGATVLTYENSTNSFRIKDVSGYQSGVSYSVRVATLYNNVWYPYGESCIITASGTTREIAEELPSKASIFAVKGYPNPYNAYFTLSLDTASDAMVYVRVFDMTGKLIEDREVAPSALESLQLGAEWASGVYNVIVAQDDQVKTIRMVKKE
ncbi:MAG: putative Ig domain-containing protein [Flavobacterium sp.]|nr:putative Ig domain-containing protein [Flavobacterium sp.]